MRVLLVGINYGILLTQCIGKNSENSKKTQIHLSTLWKFTII